MLFRVLPDCATLSYSWILRRTTGFGPSPDLQQLSSCPPGQGQSLLSALRCLLPQGRSGDDGGLLGDWMVGERLDYVIFHVGSSSSWWKYAGYIAKPTWRFRKPTDHPWGESNALDEVDGFSLLEVPQASEWHRFFWGSELWRVWMVGILPKTLGMGQNGSKWKLADIWHWNTYLSRVYSIDQNWSRGQWSCWFWMSLMIINFLEAGMRKLWVPDLLS